MGPKKMRFGAAPTTCLAVAMASVGMYNFVALNFQLSGGPPGDGAESLSNEHMISPRNAQILPASAPPARVEDGSRTVYTCGWDQGNLSRRLFPDYAFGGRVDGSPAKSPSKDDVLVHGEHGHCRGHAHRNFPGRVLVINGEGGDMFRTEPASLGAPVRGYFGPTAFVGQYGPERWDSLFIHEKKPANTGERFLLYLVSRCFEHREAAFDALSEVGSSPAYYGGACRGNAKNANRTKVLRAPEGEVTPRSAAGYQGTAPWRDNYRIFRRYRFCLVMENKSKGGYITEKIINGFLGGCVPVYWGTREIFRIFNRKAFVFYDVKFPQLALSRVARLERNRTAYEEVLREPILAQGERTIERYFSYADSVGNGTQKRRIREMLGLRHA